MQAFVPARWDAGDVIYVSVCLAYSLVGIPAAELRNVLMRALNRSVSEGG
jgi:hypothetical protein